MLKVCCELDLFQKPVGTENRGELGMKNLDRNASVVPRVLSEKDRCHSTATELPLDSIAITQRCCETLCRVGHVRRLAVNLLVRNRAANQHRDVVFTARIERVLSEAFAPVLCGRQCRR